MLSETQSKYSKHKAMPNSCSSNNNKLLQEYKYLENLLDVEQIIPGIYLDASEDAWTPEKLRIHGFTHIISINRKCDSGMDDLEKLELNFGESFLTTVLPNCYKAVKFIEKALTKSGAILVFEKRGYQKCITIVVGYIMFKYNLNFLNAFEILKNGLSYVELDKYYVTQLHEYEPILQVERIQMRGHSCSGELRRASLKRKKTYGDEIVSITDIHHHQTYPTLLRHNLTIGGSSNMEQ